MLSVITMNVAFYYYYAECHYAECHYAECRYAECRGAFKFALIIEGVTGKVHQVIMPLKTIATKTIILMNKKVCLKTVE
jgi:hypothetical protein